MLVDENLDNSLDKSFQKLNKQHSNPSVDDEASIIEGTLESYLNEQKAAEADQAIKLRSCSLTKTTFLLFSEYSCLAILSFPWSYSVLGLVPGIILTIAVCISTLVTGEILWKYCLRHPTALDICDIGKKLFWNKQWAWWFTAVCFVLNNVFIMGLHLLTFAEYLNTIVHPFCTIIYSVIGLFAILICACPRTLSGMSQIGVFSAVTMFIAAMLTIIFAAIQDHPYNFDPSTPVTWSAWPQPGTRFVDAMSAFLNIVFTFVGQITYPSFIAEMKNPRRFHIALRVVTVCEIVVFTLVGAIVYVYAGNEYTVAPAVGSLERTFKLIAFSFALPTLLFLGALYLNITAKFIFLRIFNPLKSRHAHSHTLVAWSSWIGILFALSILAFIIAEVIPFFSSLLSLMSSLFDCWFGFVFWGVAWIRMRQEDYGPGWYKKLTLKGKLLLLMSVSFIGIGFFILGPGVYATVQTIIDAYAAGTVSGAFSCASNGL